MVQFLSVCNIVITLWANAKCEHDTDQLKEFERLMGEPNIYYDEDNNLNLLVTIHKGPSNRIVDSGIESVGVQLKDFENSTLDKNLVQYMSKMLSIDEKLFKVTQGKGIFKKVLKICGSKVTPYEVIDKLVDAFEKTAKEAPRAIQINNQATKPHNHNKTNSESNEDPVQVFDWRNRFQE